MPFLLLTNTDVASMAHRQNTNDTIRDKSLLSIPNKKTVQSLQNNQVKLI